MCASFFWCVMNGGPVLCNSASLNLWRLTLRALLRASFFLVRNEWRPATAHFCLP